MRSLLLVCLTALPALAAAPAEFTTTMTGKGREGPVSGTLAVSPKKLRVDLRDADKKVAVIVDRQTRDLFITDEANKLVIRLQPKDEPYQAMTKVLKLLPDPSGNPCANAPEDKCEKLGDEKRGGKKVAKWKVVSKRTDGRTEESVIYMDKATGYYVRTEEPADGTFMDFGPLKPGAPAASFQFPSEYQQLDMAAIQQMVNQMKADEERRGVGKPPPSPLIPGK